MRIICLTQDSPSAEAMQALTAAAGAELLTRLLLAKAALLAGPAFARDAVEHAG